MTHASRPEVVVHRCGNASTERVSYIDDADLRQSHRFGTFGWKRVHAPHPKMSYSTSPHTTAQFTMLTNTAALPVSLAFLASS